MAYSASWVNSTPADPCVVTVSPSAHDVLIAWAVTDSTGSDPFSAVTGFTAVGFQDIASSDGSQLKVWIKNDATGGETSVSIGGATCIAGVVAFSGRDNTTPQSITAQFKVNTGTNDPPLVLTSTSATPSGSDSDIVIIYDADKHGTYSAAFTGATTVGSTGSWTTRQTQNNGFYSAGLMTTTWSSGAITVTGSADTGVSNKLSGAMCVMALTAATGVAGVISLFRNSILNGLGSGGPFFNNGMG